MKYQLINLKTGQPAGVIDEKELELYRTGPYTKGKYRYEELPDAPKTAPKAVKESAKKADDKK